ncbi:MAG: 1-acyl-sn-glycerol-3-phosphate acyltransferase [Spirochaetia bacterium]|nr:1-acyl-sn-glycerol-3-phosphate acyltransferase [Spirochaetia bacterium]
MTALSFKKYFQTPSWQELQGKSLEYWLLRGFSHAALDAMRAYSRLETEGLENIPKHGPAIVTPNHSGVLGWDALIVQNEIVKQGGRIPRTMSHNFWHQPGVFKYLSEKMGYFPQDFKMAVRLLRKNKLMLLFPEAELGNFKPSTRMYQLEEFNPGFVSLAVMTGAPIIPTCVIGAEEAHLNLGTLDWTEKYIGAKVPLPLNLIPLPVKWKIIFMKPISVTNYSKKEAKNIRFLEEVAENVRFRIQSRIHKELVHRGVFKFFVDG